MAAPPNSQEQAPPPQPSQEQAPPPQTPQTQVPPSQPSQEQAPPPHAPQDPAPPPPTSQDQSPPPPTSQDQAPPSRNPSNPQPPNQDNPTRNSNAAQGHPSTTGPETSATSAAGNARETIDAFLARNVSYALGLEPLQLILVLDTQGLNPRGTMEQLVDRLARHSTRERFGPEAVPWNDEVDYSPTPPVTAAGFMRMPAADDSVRYDDEGDRTSSPARFPARSGNPPPPQTSGRQGLTPQDLQDQGLAGLDPLARGSGNRGQAPPAMSGSGLQAPQNAPSPRRADNPLAGLRQPTTAPHAASQVPLNQRPPPARGAQGGFLPTGQSMGPFQDPLPMDSSLSSQWDATMESRTAPPPSTGPHVTFGPDVEGGGYPSTQSLAGHAQTTQRPAAAFQRGIRRPSYNSTYRLDAAGTNLMDTPAPTNPLPPFHYPTNPTPLYQTYQAPSHFMDSRGNPVTRNHKLIEALRRDDFVYSGKVDEDPYAFLERLEEAMGLYDLTEDEILRALPAAFKGHAATWFRTEKGFMLSLADFRAAFQETFCPAERNESLWQDVRRRTQGEKETMRDYLICMKGLFSHIHPTPPIEQQLNIIHSQLHPQYLKQIPRRYISSYAELLAAGKDIEKMKESCNRYRPPPTPAESYSPAFACIPPAGAPRTKAATHAQAHAVAAPQQPPPVQPTQPPMNSYAHIPRLMDVPVAPPSQWPAPHTGQAPGPQTDPNTCYRCNQLGHFARDCPRPRPRYQPSFPPRVPPNYQYTPQWNYPGYQEAPQPMTTQQPQYHPPGTQQIVPTPQNSQAPSAQGNGNQGQR